MAAQTDNQDSPEELGRRLLAACRWCDDMRRLALDGIRRQRPDATPYELDEILYEFRLRWERIGQRLRRRQSFIRRDG